MFRALKDLQKKFFGYNMRISGNGICRKSKIVFYKMENVTHFHLLALWHWLPNTSHIKQTYSTSPAKSSGTRA